MSDLLRPIALALLRWDRLRRFRHNQFMRSHAAIPSGNVPSSAPTRVLVLGVYMADRQNTVEHLARAFATAGRSVHVEQRWVALNGCSEDEIVRQVTTVIARRAEPKFALLNRLLKPSDTDDFDFVFACDDDIYLPQGFLPAYIAHQRMLDFAVAQPSRAWHSHFDHAFALRRPWLQARQTRFVECGPLVSFRRDAACLLLPFDQEEGMWGIDLVWPAVIERHGLTMGIVDAVPVDHSVRPQASTYDKSYQYAAMGEYLSKRPHIPMQEAFTVVKRYPLRW